MSAVWHCTWHTHKEKGREQKDHRKFRLFIYSLAAGAKLLRRLKPIIATGVISRARKQKASSHLLYVYIYAKSRQTIFSSRIFIKTYLLIYEDYCVTFILAFEGFWWQKTNCAKGQKNYFERFINIGSRYVIKLYNVSYYNDNKMISNILLQYLRELFSALAPSSSWWT